MITTLNLATRRGLGVTAAVVALVVTGVVVGLGGSTAQASALRPAPHYYLAVGDSISYGFQTAKALAGDPPSAFDTGYVDHVAADLRRHQRGIRVVNFACPGESTTSITQPCIWKATGHELHHDYFGPQLRAVLQFLRNHPGQVDPITVSLGGNDVNDYVATCTPGDVACIQAGAPAAIQALAARLGTIVGSLRQAAPRARIVVVGLYDPDVTALDIADPLFAHANAALSAVATAAHARFADVMARFNPAQDEAATVCQLTLVCSAADSHPSDAGYAVMAEVVWCALTTNEVESRKEEGAVRA